MIKSINVRISKSDIVDLDRDTYIALHNLILCGSEGCFVNGSLVHGRHGDGEYQRRFSYDSHDVVDSVLDWHVHLGDDEVMIVEVFEDSVNVINVMFW